MGYRESGVVLKVEKVSHILNAIQLNRGRDFTVKKSRLIFFASTMLYAIFQWLIIATIARLGSKFDLGSYAMSIAVLSPFFMFLNMKLRIVLIAEKDDDKADRILNTRVVLGSISSIFGFIAFSINPSGVMSVFSAIFAYKGAECVHDILLGSMQRKGSYRRLASSTVLSIFWCYSAYLSFYLLYESMSLALLIMAVTRVIFVLRDLVFLKPLVKEYLSFHHRTLLLYFPLGLASLIGSINTNIPRYVLAMFSSLEAVGIYAALSYAIILVSLVVLSIFQIYANTIADELNENNDSITLKLIACAAIALGVVGFGVSLFMGDFLLGLLYGEEYSSYQYQLAMLSLVGVVVSLAKLMQSYLTIRGVYKHQMWIMFFEGILLIFLAILLVPSYGIFGICSAFLFVMSLEILVICRIALRLKSSTSRFSNVSEVEAGYGG